MTLKGSYVDYMYREQDMTELTSLCYTLIAVLAVI